MNRLLDPTRPAAYVALIPTISKIAREFGYACAVHGSMSTDLDLILVPWADHAGEAQDVVEAIRLAIGGKHGRYDSGKPVNRPFGRLVWSFYLQEQDERDYGGTLPYVDISVTPKEFSPKETV